MAADGIQIEGMEKLLKRLDSFPPKIRRRIQRKVIRKAGAPFLREAKRRAPVGPTGNLRRSFMGPKARKIKMLPDGQIHGKFGAVYTVAPHQHLVERGTVRRFRGKRKIGRKLYAYGGATTGVMPPKPFARQAWMAVQGRAGRVLRDTLGDEIEKEAAAS